MWMIPNKNSIYYILINTEILHNPYLDVGNRISSWKSEFFIPEEELVNLYFKEDNLNLLDLVPQ